MAASAPNVRCWTSALASHATTSSWLALSEDSTRSRSPFCRSSKPYRPARSSKCVTRSNFLIATASVRCHSSAGELIGVRYICDGERPPENKIFGDRSGFPATRVSQRTGTSQLIGVREREDSGMRFLFAAAPNPSHYHIHVPIARALRDGSSHPVATRCHPGTRAAIQSVLQKHCPLSEHKDVGLPGRSRPHGEQRL